MNRRRLLTTTLALVICCAALTSTALAETIRLSGTVPSFNQNYTDGPDAWGDCSLGTGGCPDQLCTTGCLVTAFASVLGYYDVRVNVTAANSCTGRARSGMDPGILNDWLRANRGFGQCSQDPIGSCCLAWDQLPGNVELTFYSNRSDVGLNPVAAVVIDHALRGGHPVVAGVHWGSSCRAGSSQSEDCHWVILTGKAGDTYTIVDPMNTDPTAPQGVRTTLDAGTRGSYIIDRYVVVTRDEPSTESVAPPSVEPVDGTSADDGSTATGTALALFGLLAAVAVIIVLVTSR